METSFKAFPKRKVAFSNNRGYDYEFVSCPPSHLECSVCLLILRNPSVVSCCGNHFCEPCIGRIKSDNKPCPLCKDVDYNYMLHKGVMREVNGLEVYCPEKRMGCDWTGDLGKVDCHLNLGSRDSGCLFVEIECANRCGSMVLRKYLSKHESEKCPNRPVDSSNSANSYIASEMRKEMNAMRRKMDAMREEKMTLEGDLSSTKSQLQNLKSKVVSLEASIIQLSMKVQESEQGKGNYQQRISSLEEVVQKVVRVEQKQMFISTQMNKLKEEFKHDVLLLENRMTPLPPFYFTLNYFEYFVQDKEFQWQSKSFYAFPRGFKFIASIYPNGTGRGIGRYLSLYVSIVGGEYDEELQWPFTGTVYVQIYNNSTGSWVTNNPVQFEESDSLSFTGKPEGLNASNPGLGCSPWLAKTELQEDYCCKGVVKFKVEKVTWRPR